MDKQQGNRKNRSTRWKKQRNKLIFMYTGLGLMVVIVIAAVLSLTRNLIFSGGPDPTAATGGLEAGLNQGYRPSGADDHEPTAEEVEEFYDNTLFIGDSIIVGFGRYLEALNSDCLSGPEVVASVGYSLQEALLPLEDCKRHPEYNGTQMTIFDAVSLIRPEKIVLSFGLNDLNMNTVPQIVENYGKVIERLRQINPEVQIYIISCSWVFRGRESATLNNNNVKELNRQVSEFCAKNKVGFINMAPYLSDESGYLYSGYTSDFYIHQNANAYQTWVQLLRRYAYWQLCGKEAPEEMFPITKPGPVVNIPDETLSPTEPIVIKPENTAPVVPHTTVAPTPEPGTQEPPTNPATEPPATEAPTTAPAETSTAAETPAPTEPPETKPSATAAPTEAPVTTTAQQNNETDFSADAPEQ
ncbi:GDSL-type esterase/lipase family protein [Cuneatibacter caecimuris]|uniref:GDSL-like lipase/acylhydrolase family protein n=1 Tax=Cuneatibacter caecimuris TaxID=1796618 RepID=A0A4Q7PP11_9FIRM|nr:GDSL-type esterase/lipase family protein [Cuneatibacter caecimuris]RZT01996.1 GDSL-like lipase/acylhydrolase family protein [Cuneatibacter caecimuris]